MTEKAASVQPVSPSSAASPEAAIPWPWLHLGWVASVVAAAGALLAGLGGLSWPALGALVVGAAPGLVGFLWRPNGRRRLVLLLAWAAASVLAGTLVGGVNGPFALWCATPLLAGALIGWLAEGAVLSAAALATTGLIQLAGGAWPAPAGAFGFGLSAAALLTTGAALLAVLMNQLRARAAVEQATTSAHNALTVAEAARTSAETERDAAAADAVGKSRFLANMSHELRTPLNAIMGFSDIMRTKMFGELQGKYAEYAELIHESGRHLTDLINDVLDMSKIEAERYDLSREVFDVREAVNAALRLVRLQADEARIQLRGVSPPQALIVDADRRAIKQIVLNLVSNALKFTPAGGSVTVTVQAAGGALELVVADTGVGIAKDDLERLGRPFEQAGDAEHRAQGTGLGLSLVKAFARLHGGEMNIESALGEGVAVTVRLPVLAQEDEIPAAATPPPPFASGDGAQTPPASKAMGPSAADPEAPRMGEVIPLNLQR